MLLSKKWLQDFVEIPANLSDQDLAERISACTVEVEEIVSQAGPLEKIVVGKILSVNPHPNADKLRVCEVNLGTIDDAPVQIVCGGSNLSDGMKVAVATVGAKVKWHGEGELVEIAPTKLRGVDSFGMICSANEIGLATGQEGEKEIVDLSYLEVEPGTSLAEALNLDDTIFDVDNKSLTNRPDLFGHHGMAREISALLSTKFSEFVPKKMSGGKGFSLSVNVEDPELCPRYMGVVIDGLKVAPSPDWLQKRLFAVGMRPINNLVDVTNYVMLEIGQSLHAFDASKLENSGRKEKTVEIVVKRATDKEKFKTLDGQEHELNSDVLMICDGKKPVTMAGIMGGQNSEIDENTTTVFLESANFNSACIRKTSQKLGLRTEASLRYEKSLDPNLAELALARTLELIFELVPSAKIVSPIVDASNFELNQGPIVLSIKKLNSKLGFEIDLKEAVGILERLGFEVKEKADELLVKIPSWRATKDISIAEDLIEEIARVYGYEKIVSSLPTAAVVSPIKDPVRELSRKVRHILAERFLSTETYNYSFVSPVTLLRMKEELKDYIELANPVSKERPYLRRCLATNLLENVEKNQKFSDTVSLFEVGCRYISELPGEESGEGKVLPRQDNWLGLAFSKKGDSQPFREVKRALGGLLEELGYDFELKAPEEKFAWGHPSRLAEIFVADKIVGYLSEVDPGVATDLGLDSRTAVGEINLTHLATLPVPEKKYEKIPEFPDVKRDLAFIVARSTEYSVLEKSLQKVSELLHNIELFDIYQGKGIDPDKKSVAIHLTFRATDRTLSSEEVGVEMEKLVTVINDEFSGIIR
ncbi:MAG: phenylalanine--tRNA ligase subunit beta [Candidatus Uhrbacteria bacterium]